MIWEERRRLVTSHCRESMKLRWGGGRGTKFDDWKGKLPPVDFYWEMEWGTFQLLFLVSLVIRINLLGLWLGPGNTWWVVEDAACRFRVVRRPR